MARRYTMVDTVVAPPESPSKGYSSLIVRDLFPASPIYLEAATDIEDFTDAGITAWYQTNILDATIIDDGTFAEFDTGFVNPDGWDVATGGGGLPANRWVPNPVSPGPGTTNPATTEAAPSAFSEADPAGGTFGEGGSTTSPETTSEEIAGTTMGDYIMWKGFHP